MSPYPLRAGRKNIIEAARLLIEQEGVEELSLAKLANAVGVKAPSLYKHIKNKESLLHAVIEATYQNLFTAYDQALQNSGATAEERILALSDAHYQFAHANPNTYVLAYSTIEPEQFSDTDLLLKQAVQVQDIVSEIAGETNSLTAYRGLLALTHGFVMLELNGQFRRGGDLQQTLRDAVHAYLHGWH